MKYKIKEALKSRIKIERKKLRNGKLETNSRVRRKMYEK